MGQPEHRHRTWSLESFLRLSLKLSKATDWYLQKVAAACWNASPLGPSNCFQIKKQIVSLSVVVLIEWKTADRVFSSPDRKSKNKKILTMATRISPTVSTAGWSLLRAFMSVLKRPWISNMSGKLGKSRLTRSLKPLSSSGR